MWPENPLICQLRKLCGSSKLFLVGGSVRDLLEDRVMKDYDFLIEGDVFNFALGLAARLNCKMTLNRQLLTASLETKWGTVDIACARRETYAYPGALPSVSPATWQEDLSRRDFTINALAVPLLKKGWGKLIDLSGGQKDIVGKLIRSMHEDSFQDDPTRMLRALRLKNRLVYRVEEKTFRCMQRDWKYLDCLSSARRFKEWVLLSAEAGLPEILRDLYEFGGWTKFLPVISYTPGMTKYLSEIRIPEKTSGFRPWFLYLLVLLTLSQGDPDYFISAWELSAKDVTGLTGTLNLVRQKNLQALRKREQLSKMRKLPLEGLYLLYRQLFVDQYTWDEFYRGVHFYKMPLDGQDLMLLGLEPGPLLGMILERLEDSYEKEKFDKKEEGIELAKQLIKEETP